jgi:hypothetical protein
MANVDHSILKHMLKEAVDAAINTPITPAQSQFELMTN